MKPFNLSQHLGRSWLNAKDCGIKGDGIADDTIAIQAAEDACALSGRALYFPAGNYRHAGTINKKSVDWHGDGLRDSQLLYSGAARAINSVGTSADRILCTVSDMWFNGVNAGPNAQGLAYGWNMRSVPLVRCYVSDFGAEGIYFADQNWIVKFEDVIVERCGKLKANSSGLGKDPAVTGSTWNAISFVNLNVENCGSATSDAGAINFQTNSANRGLYFVNCCIEGNFARLTGTPGAEILITNMIDCQFLDHYMEVVSAQCRNAIDLRGVSGSVRGGYISGDNIAVNQVGIKVRAGAGFASNALEISGGVQLSRFAASVDADDAIIVSGLLTGERKFVGGPNAQFQGSISPRVSVAKAAAQAIPNNVITKVIFETELGDATNAFDLVTNPSRFTPKTIGLYLINAAISWELTGVNDGIILLIYKNGAIYRRITNIANTNSEKTVAITALVEVTATADYFEIFVRQTSGVSQNIEAFADRTWAQFAYLGTLATSPIVLDLSELPGRANL